MSPGWVRTQGLGLGLWSMDSDLDSDSVPMDSDSHLMDPDSNSGLVDSDSLLDSWVRTHSNTANMLPWQQMCNGKHFSKLDITSYDNGIGIFSMDIWQIHVQLCKKSSYILKKINKNTHIQKCTIFNKMMVLFRFEFKGGAPWPYPWWLARYCTLDLGLSRSINFFDRHSAKMTGNFKSLDSVELDLGYILTSNLEAKIWAAK